jgi:hypothetical protein
MYETQADAIREKMNNPACSQLSCRCATTEERALKPCMGYRGASPYRRRRAAVQRVCSLPQVPIARGSLHERC